MPGTALAEQGPRTLGEPRLTRELGEVDIAELARLLRVQPNPEKSIDGETVLTNEFHSFELSFQGPEGNRYKVELRDTRERREPVDLTGTAFVTTDMGEHIFVGPPKMVGHDRYVDRISVTPVGFETATLPYHLAKRDLRILAAPRRAAAAQRKMQRQERHQLAVLLTDNVLRRRAWGRSTSRCLKHLSTNIRAYSRIYDTGNDRFAASSITC